jgi:hypothetical protein
VGASATQHVVQNLVRDTTRDEDVRVFLFSASAFCVALGVPGVFVDQRIAWSDPMLIYKSNRLYSLRGFHTHGSGEWVVKRTGEGGCECSAPHGRACGHVAIFMESSWRRTLGSARSCGVIAALEP